MDIWATTLVYIWATKFQLTLKTMRTIERSSPHLVVLTCKVLHEFVLIDQLLSFSQKSKLHNLQYDTRGNHGRNRNRNRKMGIKVTIQNGHFIPLLFVSSGKSENVYCPCGFWTGSHECIEGNIPKCQHYMLQIPSWRKIQKVGLSQEYKSSES